MNDDSDSCSSSCGPEDIEYYNSNLLLPVFSTDNKILSPHEAMNVLFSIDTSVSSELVCAHQPLHVQHNRTFIVNLDLLKCQEDIKCDDIGSWKNQSYNKFFFTKNENDWALLTRNQDDESRNQENQIAEIVTLKRQYFSLQGDRDNQDFRRRIDLVTSK